MIFQVPNLKQPQTFSFFHCKSKKYFYAVDIFDWRMRHLLYIQPIRNTLNRPDGQCKLSGKLANFIFWVASNNMTISFSNTAEYFHGSWLFAIINIWFIPGTVCKIPHKSWFTQESIFRPVRRSPSDQQFYW